MRVIDISSISGLTDPYLIQVCDVYGSNCVFLSQIFTTVPPTVTVYLPPQFDSAPSVMVKVTTLDGCEKTEILDCISLYTLTPTPTPSITPTLTPTPTLTITPTITPTPTICAPQMIYSGEKFTNLEISNSASFKPDGTILYIAIHNGSPTDSVCAYSLSTPWDVSTITLPRIGCSIAVPVISGLTPTSVIGHHFSPDGSKLFVVEMTSKSVLRYILSTPWDVTTSSYSPGDLFTIVGLTPGFIDFTPDGLFMFVTVTGGLLKKYSLTTPWVISSGVVEIQSISFGLSYDFTFQNNGYYLFSMISSSGTLNIRRQTLSIPYDLTSIVSILTQTESVSGFIPAGNLYTITFRDGYKGFISGYYSTPTFHTEIYAFNLTCEYDINGIVILPTLTPTPTPTKTPTPTPTPFVWGAISNILYSGTTSGDTCLFVPTDPLSYTGPVYLQFGSGTCCVTSFSDDITSIGRHWYISVSPFVDFPNGWYKLYCPAFPLYNNRLVQITSGLVTQQLYC